MIDAGQRQYRISFERNNAGRSAMGGPASPSWQVLFTRFSNVRWGSSAERRAAAGEQAIQSGTFRVLADNQTRGVRHTDRIVFDGLSWDITSIAPIGGPAPREIEFTATASRD